MTPEWKDVTGYSRDDTERIPRTWEVMLGDDRICVTRHVHHNPRAWCLNWRGVTRAISHGTLDEAKGIALDLVILHTEAVLKAARAARKASR